MRLRVFERDGWKCRYCERDGQTLNAHHSVYRPDASGPWDYDEETIITLCEECHGGEYEALRTAHAELLTELAKKGFWHSDAIGYLAWRVRTGELV